MAGESILTPIGLTALLNSTYVIPGDRIHIRGGIYAGDFICTFNGTVANRITFQPYLNEKPKIDGSIQFYGSYTLWKEIEVYSSNWTTRTNLEGTGNPCPWNLPVKIQGTGHILSGMIFHDLQELDCFDQAIGTILTGCLSYHIGWIGTDRPHGHGFYLKNTSTQRKTLKRCISVNVFRHAVNCYREGATNSDYIDLIENVSITPGYVVEGHFLDNRMITGGSGSIAIENPKWYRNMLYHCVGDIGGACKANNVERVDNYMPYDCYVEPGTTFDLDSGNTVEIPESGKEQFCFVNEYNPNKGILVFFNWDLDDTVTADLSNITGLSIGDTVRLRCAEDYDKCYQDLLLNASKEVDIDMRAISHTVATAIGHDYTPPTTCPEFGCFMIEKI